MARGREQLFRRLAFQHPQEETLAEASQEAGKHMVSAHEKDDEQSEVTYLECVLVLSFFTHCSINLISSSLLIIFKGFCNHVQLYYCFIRRGNYLIHSSELLF